MNELLYIEGLRNKDKVVFDYIFNYFYSSLCVFSMQYIKDKDSVEDIVQDVFVTLWIDAPNIKIQTSLRSYLFASVKNRCLDIKKHQNVTEKYKTYVLFSSECGSDTSDHLFSESELRINIQKSLGKLPPRCREIFELSRYNYLSNRDISDKLKISQRTVELQISNALKIFRKELKDFLPIWLIAFLLDNVFLK